MGRGGEKKEGHVDGKVQVHSGWKEETKKKPSQVASGRKQKNNNNIITNTKDGCKRIKKNDNRGPRRCKIPPPLLLLEKTSLALNPHWPSFRDE